MQVLFLFFCYKSCKYILFINLLPNRGRTGVLLHVKTVSRSLNIYLLIPLVTCTWKCFHKYIDNCLVQLIKEAFYPLV